MRPENMGYKRSYDMDQAMMHVRRAESECRHPAIDGFTAWGVKQDLYLLKWLVDDAIKRCPTFGPEQDWLRDQEQKKIIKILKDEM
jgi:hypothetical protein